MASISEKSDQHDSIPSPSHDVTEAQQPVSFISPHDRKPHDHTVKFEEYLWYAARTRLRERELPSDLPNRPSKLRTLKSIISRGPQEPAADEQEVKHTTKLEDGKVADNERGHIEISENEWTNASRLVRSAGAGACFFLITTDILGPYGVGFALGTLGWGPGIALYTVFGFMAGYSGYLLWKMFLELDSYEYPAKNYGDLAFRIYGRPARHLVNLLQGILLVCLLGQVTIQNGQGLSQVGRFRLCYAVCCVIFILAGFFIGQVRTLQKYGWLANCAVFLNLLVIFISMGVMAHSPPNYAISVLGSAGSATVPSDIQPTHGKYPAVKHYGNLPDPSSFVGAINGLLQAVFAYGGSQLFIEFMAEMRRPYDFIKAMWSAQLFIYVVYLVYGCYVYNFQGQYSYQISYQGLSIYGWQTAGNMLAVLSGLIAAGLYSNIGIKVFYNNVLIDLFNAPALTTRAGKILWVIIVPIWWAIAFVIAAAIPDYFGFVSIISAIAVVQFTYSFPAILIIGFNIKKYAMASADGFDPHTGIVRREGSGSRRILRGLFPGLQIGLWNVVHFIHAGAALATAGIGAYAAIESMIEAFQNPQLNAFSCTSPLDLSKQH